MVDQHTRLVSQHTPVYYDAKLAYSRKRQQSCRHTRPTPLVNGREPGAGVQASDLLLEKLVVRPKA